MATNLNLECWVNPDNSKAIQWLTDNGFQLSGTRIVPYFTDWECCEECCGHAAVHSVKRNFLVGNDMSGKDFHRLLKANNLLMSQQEVAQ